MRFVIYKNSILASICSMFGSAMIALAVMSMINGELDILSGIAVTAAGVGLMWLGSVISERKEKKKRAKAAQAAGSANRYTSGAATAQPARPSTYTNHAPAAAQGKPVNQCAVFVGILFLMAALLNFWAINLYKMHDHFYLLNSEDAMLTGMGILLMIAAFRTRHTQKTSVLFLLGFLGLTWGSIDVAMVLYRDYGFGGYSDRAGVYYAMASSRLVKAAGFFLMTIFSLFSMEKTKRHLGGIVRWLWFVPLPMLLLVYAKDISDNDILHLLTMCRINGFDYPPRPEFLEATANFLAILAVCFSGVCFRRICKKTVTVYTQYTQPVMESAASALPMQEWPVQPQPKPQYRSPEPPQQTEQVHDPDVQQTIQAYKDLLDLEILTREEYDQKIRELLRR